MFFMCSLAVIKGCHLEGPCFGSGLGFTFWKIWVPPTYGLKHAAACRSVPQHSKGFLGDRWCLFWWAQPFGGGGGGIRKTGSKAPLPLELQWNEYERASLVQIGWRVHAVQEGDGCVVHPGNDEWCMLSRRARGVRSTVKMSV